MPLASHIQLPERYRVTRHIASGGMASVWEVEDLLLGRVVAVKVLGAQYAGDPGARARFAREARTAARVSDHPHIATIYDIGEHDEEAFIVMEYFSGGTVADQLRSAATDGRRVDRDTALRWLREAASGLDHAHRAGVVHRDVKPANLLLDAQERLAVGDFGIARLADDTSMTQTGQLLGTAAYLSPEQAVGLPATAASDRYAFAVVAYELLTGTRPFAGGPPSAQVRQHAEAEPERASDAAPELSRAVDVVFERGLAKEPAERVATAAELVGELERALAAPVTEPTRRLTPIAAPVPVPTPEPAPEPEPARAADPSPARRRTSPLLPIGLAAAVVGIVLAIAIGGASNDDPQNATPSSDRTSTQATAERRQPTTSTPAAATAPPAQTTTPAAAASSGDAAALNARGFRLMQAGDYAAAVPLLQRSVAAYRESGQTGSLDFAYALFNLGKSLNRSGDPAAAVPILRERLGFDNQRATVQQELDNALAKLGQATGTGKAHGNGNGKAKKDRDGG